MNLAAFLVDELQAARECLAVAGNAARQATDERRDELEGFAALLDAYRRVCELSVLPVLRAHGSMTPDVQAAWADLCDVAEASAAVARGRDGAEPPGPGTLVDRFEALVARQETAVIPAIRRLPPNAQAALAERARTVRLGLHGTGTAGRPRAPMGGRRWTRSTGAGEATPGGASALTGESDDGVAGELEDDVEPPNGRRARHRSRRR